MKAWIAARLMSVPGTGTVAAKDAPIVPDMHSADFGAYPSDIEASKHGQTRRAGHARWIFWQ